MPLRAIFVAKCSAQSAKLYVTLNDGLAARPMQGKELQRLQLVRTVSSMSIQRQKNSFSTQRYSLGLARYRYEACSVGREGG